MKRNLSPRSFIKDLWASREWGPARNSDPERDFQAEIEVKLEDYSEPETEDCDDWLETREYQSVFPASSVKTEDDEEITQSSQLCRPQTEQMETGADEDAWRGPGQARHSNPERNFRPEIQIKIEDSSETENDNFINEIGSAADIHPQACSTAGPPPLSSPVCFETTMHHSIVPFGTEPAFEQCKTCCRLYHCPMCPKFKPARRKKLEMHLEVHLKNAVMFKDKRICRCNLNCRDAGHFHCPMCDKTIIKKRDFEVHLDFCQTALQKTLASVAPQSELNPDLGLPAPTPVALTLFTHGSSSPGKQSFKCPELTVSPSPEMAASPPQQQHAISSSVVSTQENEKPVLLYKRVKCPHCKLILYKKNVIKHIQRRHEVHSKKMKAHDDLKGVCVDATNGISAVQKDILGSSEPIHVQMKTWGHVHRVQCEMEECRQFHLMAVRSGLTLRHCEHIRSLDHCTVIAREEFLQGEVLSEMVALKVCNEATKAACLKRQRKAQASHVPLCVPISLQENQKKSYFSIHEPALNHYSRLGRVMVTHTSGDNTWHCPCAKPRISCVHKNISKWHLFQTKRDVFETVTASASAQQEHQGPVYPPTDEDLRRLVQYIYKHKKIPAKLPDDLVKPKALINYLTDLQPAETFCVVCPGCVLEKPARITKKAKIITMSGVVKNVSTYFRSCPKCHMVYRYQEWKDGLHNFDDHILLNLDLCLYLRHNLQNNVSVSQVMSSLESLRKVEFPSAETVLHAYCHFEALMSHEYSFSCVCCGYYPPVVMMDQLKKGVSHSFVSDELKPSENFTGEVNVEEFWDSVQMEMISRGFFPSQAKNPFALNPCSEHWGPWIGRNTRKSEMVLNTEFERVSKSSPEAEVSMLPGDFHDEPVKQKASPERNLHKVFILDTTRSTGGWSVIQCPHGVVYSLKFSSRPEPSRDFADLLLSWKHLPNVSLCDFAADLATHVNLRSPSSRPFKPHDGRLAASTEENITAAQKRKLRISLPWLNKMSKNPDEDGHPVTGSSNRYALYGKSNKANAKDPQEVLSGTSLVPELQSSLNHEVAKGLLSSMHKNSYFLNSMAPSTHIFMMRNLLHLRNNDTNAKLLEEVLQSGDVAHRLQDITLNDFGQAVLGTYDIKEIDFVFS